MGLNFNMQIEESGILGDKVIGKPKSRLLAFTLNYFLLPLKSGILGFVIYFLVISGAKSSSFLIGFSNNINLGEDDLLLASVGFLYAFIFSLLKNFNKK